MSETDDHDRHHDAALAGQPLLIAVASQNARTVTPHAGRTRRFLLFTKAADGRVEEAGRFELPKAMTLHGWPASRPHPLFAVDVVVVGSAGAHFREKLARAGVSVVVDDGGAVRDAASRAAAGVVAAG